MAYEMSVFWAVCRKVKRRKKMVFSAKKIIKQWSTSKTNISCAMVIFFPFSFFHLFFKGTDGLFFVCLLHAFHQ